MNTEVEFRSSAFPPYESEAAEVNPGRWGKRLAEYVSRGLQERNIGTDAPRSEDWGWALSIQNAGFPIFVGCGNITGSDEQFLCFIHAGKPKGLGWFRKVDTAGKVSEIAEALDQILRGNSQVRDVRWFSGPERPEPKTAGSG